MPILSWIKNNKFSSFLLIIIILFIIISLTGSTGNAGLTMNRSVSTISNDMALPQAAGKMIAPGQEFTPQPDATNRMVIENSYLSLLVRDVTEVKDKIIAYAQANGGYMVNSQVSNPQDAPTATVTIRVQSARLKEVLIYLRSLSIKVVSEELQGTDVTDEYVDIEKRIGLLETTKTKFESILSSAKEISDITNLTQQILNYQSQIDSLKGSQAALEKNAQFAKITVYLSTDEIALPYAPSESFRPAVIVKLAVRSLVSILRKVATIIIWIGVYAVIWLPILVLIWFFKKYMPFNKKK
jgi:hypothetical protein